MTIITCPIAILAQRVAVSAENLERSVKDLRRQMKKCDQCQTPCSIIKEFSAAIDQALIRTVEELQLRV